MGYNSNHNGVLYKTQQIPNVTGRPRHCNKHRGEDDGDRSTNVATKMFTEDQMVPWENKTSATQTWANLQTYFTNKWLKRKQYLATTAKQSRFKEAALLTKETAAAEEEVQTQALLFTMLQEQRAKKITAMAEASKANLEEMMTMMNALVMAAGGKALPTATTTPPASGNPMTVVTKEKQVKAKALCSLCKNMVLHKQRTAPNWKRARRNGGWDGNWLMTQLDKRRVSE